MIRVEDFPDHSFEIEHIADAMPGSKVNHTDDGPCVILTNDRMEVVADRTDPDDPDCEDFTVRSAQADDPADIERFKNELGD